jgi:tetratricopeptide (TPR) repeat protein
MATAQSEPIPSTGPSSDAASRGRRGRGLHWLALALLLVGLLSLSAVLVWQWVDRVRREQEAIAAQEAREVDREALADLRERFNHAASEPHANLTSIVRQAERLAAKRPTWHEAQTLAALVHIERQDWAQAYPHIAASLELNPDQRELQLHGGTVSLKLGHRQRAREHYAQAVALDDDHARSLRHLGHLLIREGYPELAREYLERAVEMDDDSHEAHASLAELYTQQGQHEQAVRHLAQAIEFAEVATFEGMQPEKAEKLLEHYRLEQARLLLEADRPDEAAFALEALPERKLLQPEAWRRYTRAQHEMGQTDKAAKLAENALAAMPNTWEYAALAARWRIELGHESKARRHLTTLRRLNPFCPQLPELQERLKAIPDQPPEVEGSNGS